MSFRTKLARAETQIAAFLAESVNIIYTRLELREIFYKAQRHDLLASHTTLDQFIHFLVQRRHLLSITFESKRYQTTITRFCKAKPSPFQLAASLFKTGYLSHGTAAYLHGLLKKPPDTIYLNVEQSAKPVGKGALSQDRIDRAFSGKQRQSQYTFSNKELTVTKLAGKNTARADIETLIGPTGEQLQATNLERTLVDLVVRPIYGGGIVNVLEAYRGACQKVSAKRLLAVLDRLDHAYPYAQAMGFLMQRVGYPEAELRLVRERITKFRFYLSHHLKNPAYDEGWRLFYPAGLS